MVDYIFSLGDSHHKYVWLTEFAKYREQGKFATSIGHPKDKSLSASGALASLTPDQGLCLWVCLRFPVVGSRSVRSPWADDPTSL